MTELARSQLAVDRLERCRATRRALPTEDREAQLLWRLRYRVARTQLRQLFTTARLRTFLVDRPEPVFLDRPVPAVLRGLSDSSSTTSASRARTYHAQDRASSCFICSSRRST